MKQARFLVLRGGAIGDFILTLPVLEALRTRWPGCYIEILGYPHIADLAVASGLADKISSLDKAEVARFFSPFPIFSEDQSEYVQSFDIIFNYLHDPNGIVRENLSLAGAQLVIYGSPLVRQGHATDHLLKPLESLAIYDSNRFPVLRLKTEHLNEGRTWRSNFPSDSTVVAIHPGSGSPKKNWPLERYVELSTALEKSGWETVFIFGEADSAIQEKLADHVPARRKVEGRSLVQLAGILSACQAYIGNDSGVTHLAAAVGIPTFAIFGPSKPERWGPRGPNVHIVQAPAGVLGKLDLSQVIGVFQSEFE